jgi:hypothetical protein
MGERAAVCGVDNILKAYEGMRGDSPYYSVWFNGREKTFQWNTDDIEGGMALLQATGEAFSDAGDNSLYYLRIHSISQPVYKNNADTVIAGMPIRFAATEGSTGSVVSGVPVASKNGAMSYEMWEMLSASKQVPELLKQNAELMQKVIDLEADKEPSDLMGKITGFAQSNPQVIAPLFASIAGMISRLMPSTMAAGPIMAGVIDQPAKNKGLMETTSVEDEAYWAKVDEALDALQQYCDISVYLPKLAIYAEKNPDMFKLMLNSL